MPTSAPVRVELFDYQPLIKDLPIGSWVTISKSKNQVIAYSEDIHEVVKKAYEFGEKVPFIVRVIDPTLMLIL